MEDLQQIYDQYFQEVYRFVLSLSRNEHVAEEITQETFYKALKRIDSFQGTCKISVWLCQIAKNTYFSYYDQQKRYPRAELETDPASRLNVEHKVVIQSEALRIHRILHELGEPYKEVFTLRVFGELSFADICRIFGKTESWARVTFHRAKPEDSESLSGGGTMNKPFISCHVIQDLLPLYHDEVCSPDTRELVEGHIGRCPVCRAVLEKMSDELKLGPEITREQKTEANSLRRIAAYWSRSKAVAFIKGLAIATALCGLLFGGYLLLTSWNIRSVPTKVIEVADVGRMNNGTIAYHVKMTDGYNVKQVSYKLHENGNFYMTPLRPVIKSKAFADIGLANTYYWINIDEQNAYHNPNGTGTEIQAIYLGTPEDHILIWRKGMTLPPASEAAEKQLAADE